MVVEAANGPAAPTPEERARLEREASFTLERQALISQFSNAAPHGVATPGVMRGHQVYADQERRIQAYFRSARFNKAQRSEALVIAEFTDLAPHLEEAAKRCGVSAQDLLPPTPDGSSLNEFLSHLPMRSALWEMRRRRHDSGSSKFEPNDLNDLLVLSVAVVHRDIVVTEAQWTHLMKQARLDVKHNTVLLSKTAELAQYLVPRA